MTVRTIIILIALAMTGCATTAQRAKGMDNNDARREAAWTGIGAAISALIFGAPEKPKKTLP